MPLFILKFEHRQQMKFRNFFSGKKTLRQHDRNRTNSIDTKRKSIFRKCIDVIQNTQTRGGKGSSNKTLVTFRHLVAANNWEVTSPVMIQITNAVYAL